MGKNGDVLRLGEDLVSCNAAAVGFALEVTDDTMGKPLFLVIFTDGDISHDTAAERACADKFPIIEKSHGIINVSCESQIKFFQEFYNSCFFFRICQKNFSFCNHYLLLISKNDEE